MEDSLVDRLRDHRYNGQQAIRSSAADRIEADAKVIAALREALEPFAKMGTVWLFDQMTPDDYAVAGNAGGVVTAETFKKAARIYEQRTEYSAGR